MRNYHTIISGIATVFTLLAGSPVFADDFSVVLKNSNINTPVHIVTSAMEPVAGPVTIRDYVNNQRFASNQPFAVSMQLYTRMGTWQDALGNPPKL